MGKTVESYRMALEDEIQRWKGFAKALRIEDREAFETLMDACRSYASAGRQRRSTRTLRTHDHVHAALAASAAAEAPEGIRCSSNAQAAPDHVKGWILDAYPAGEGEIAVWIISETGERIKLHRQVPTQNLRFSQTRRTRTLSQQTLQQPAS